MKLLIIDKYNKNEISVPLLEKVNSDLEFYKDYIFVENGTYSVKVDFETESGISEVYLFLGDICVNIQYDEIENIACLDNKRIFEDCFDAISIKIDVLYYDGNEKVLETPNLYVAIKKITCQYVQRMFKDIEDNYQGILNTFYSAGRKRIGITKSEVRGFKDTISLLSIIYTTLREVYPMFQQSINKTLSEQYKYSKSANVNKLDNQAINWIITHPEYVNQSVTPTSICIKQKYYSVDQINFLDKKESCETYENRAVLGFINTILQYINEKCLELENIIKEFDTKIPYAEIEKLPQDYDLGYKSVLFYYKELLRILKNYNESFGALFDAYLSCLKCTSDFLTSVPRYTFIFRQQYHYRRCFDSMVLWCETGNCNLQSIGSFLRLKKLSRMFEYYTLLKLKEAIIKNDFKPYDEPKYLMYENVRKDDINNFYSYIYKNGQTVVSLYYEPYIYTDKIKHGIDLYSTGYHFSKILKENRIRINNYWTPDFVLKFENSGKVLYFILDSKFSSYLSVQRYHIAELVNKYILGIASTNEYYSKIAGVWAIYPSEKGESLSLKKNLINSRKASLPIIAIEPLLTQDNSLRELIGYMHELFDEIYKDEL